MIMRFVYWLFGARGVLVAGLPRDLWRLTVRHFLTWIRHVEPVTSGPSEGFSREVRRAYGRRRVRRKPGGFGHWQKTGELLPIGGGATPAIPAVGAAGPGYWEDAIETILGRVRDRVVDVRDHEAVGDGVTDDTAALNDAFATSGIVVLPPGNYLITSNLNQPTAAAILGAGRTVTTITAAAGVTKVLSLKGNKTIGGLTVAGNATASAVGVFFGDGGSGTFNVSELRVTGFSGASSVGIRLKDILKSSFVKVTTDLNTTGMLSDASVGFPTTVDFRSMVTTNNGVGVQLLAANGFLFSNCVFESNTAQGVLVDATSQEVEAVFDSCWFEDNNSGTGFAFESDVTAASVNARLVIKDTRFNLSGTTRAIRMSGARNRGFVIDNPRLPSSPGTGAILIENGAQGWIVNWPRATSYSPTVVDTAKSGTTPFGGAQGPSGPWTAWTPTFSSDLGDSATTFTATPTVTVARFRVFGDQMFVHLKWSGTLKALTPAWLGITLPTGTAPAGGAHHPGATQNNGTWELGHFQPVGGGLLRQHRAQTGAPYTSGGAVGGEGTFVMEVAW